MQRFVLLALSDHANDKNECWPSVEVLAKKTGMTTRSIINQLNFLEMKSWVNVDRKMGRVNRYLLAIPMKDVHPCKTFTRETDSLLPVKDVHAYPCKTFTQPVKDVHPNHKESSLEPIIESLVEKSPTPKKNKKSEKWELVDAKGMSDEYNTAIRDFVEHRKAIKKPLTRKALELTESKLEKLNISQLKEIEIIHKVIERGWQSFEIHYPEVEAIIKRRDTVVQPDPVPLHRTSFEEDFRIFMEGQP